MKEAITPLFFVGKFAPAVSLFFSFSHSNRDSRSGWAAHTLLEYPCFSRKRHRFSNGWRCPGLALAVAITQPAQLFVFEPLLKGVADALRVSQRIKRRYSDGHSCKLDSIADTKAFVAIALIATECSGK
jgi:hypothetical protein